MATKQPKELFFDLETVPKCKWEVLPEGLKKIWIEKQHYNNVDAEIKFQSNKKAISEGFVTRIDMLEKDMDLSHEYIWNKYSPLHPEFGQILVISIGLIKADDTFDIKTIPGETEKDMITKFFQFLYDNPHYILCGVNIKGFDVPYLFRKSIEYGLKLPQQLEVLGKKPWEINMIDLGEDYKGGMRNMVSLDLMCESLGIKSPKDKFANHEVSNLYMKGIVKRADVIQYCEKDIKATIQVFLKIYC
jgi:hypothetical protein